MDRRTDSAGASSGHGRGRRPGLVTVVHQVERAAREPRATADSTQATGDWVTFTDPDDMLDRRVLRLPATAFSARPSGRRGPGDPSRSATTTATDQIRRRPSRDAGSFAARLARGRPPDRAPSTLAGVVDDEPSTRSARLRAIGLRFEPRLRPTFEDGHFAARYVLVPRRPAHRRWSKDARYIYRRGADGPRLPDPAGRGRDPGRYSTTLELGYLDLVARAKPAGRLRAALAAARPRSTS